MAYQTTVTLTDVEYSALSVQAAKSGKALETFLHELLAQHVVSTSETPSLTSEDIQNYLYSRGIIEHVPTNEPDTEEEKAQRKYLARLFGQGKPVSEMVIEDRGPY